MLIKILFTLLVIIIVALVFRNRNTSRTESKPPPQTLPGEPHSPSVRSVTYGLIVVLILVSAAIFISNYRSENRIVNIRVISEDGISTTYQARQKHIKGRQFLTLGGKQVRLGESDRIEMQQ